MRYTGIVLIALAFAAPLIWYVPLMAKHDPIALFSQYIGSVSLIAMGISMMMATRMRWQQTIFGGLDQIYWLHKWLGIIAIVTVLIHDTVDAEIDGLGRETLLVEFAETLGEISLYGLLILVVITIATYIPYHIWRWTHYFMGAFFTASALHYFFILKPFINIDPLGLYVGFFCILGIVCYLVTLIPFAAIEGRHRYKIASLEPTGDALAVTLEPQGGGLVHRAGQFAFVRFPGKGRNELHPFTISSAPNKERTIRFTFKPLGDDTKKLAKALAEGDEARLSPSYGHFSRPKQSERPEVWIAGGIGVTPFAAFAQSLDETCPPIHFFYCVREGAQAAHREMFEALAAKLPNFHFHLIESRTDGRLSFEKVEAVVGDKLPDACVYYCGPEALRDTMKKAFSANGLSPRRFKYEEFEIRSGIGLAPVFDVILKPLGTMLWNRFRDRQADAAR